MALSHKLTELACDGVTDPEELRRLALESFPLTNSSEPSNTCPEASTDHPPEGERDLDKLDAWWRTRRTR
jgi:hypothetical protein